MRIEKHQINLFGTETEAELMRFGKEDSQQWKEYFHAWKALKFGMRAYKSREPNFPEGLSEVAWCLFSGSLRFISANVVNEGDSSFDTYNLETQRAEQIKATSIKRDLSSFGPKTKWQDLYFLDFYNEGKLDGTFNAYKIPSQKIPNLMVNQTETFAQHQAQGRRPRFSIVDNFINTGNAEIVAENIKIF